MTLIQVILYTRDGCSLCEDAYYLLKYLAYDYPLDITLFDITTDPEVELKYLLEIPVVTIANQVTFTSVINEQAVRDELDKLLKS